MNTTYVLIAGAHRARCFERSDGDHALTELADFVQPHPRLAGGAQGADLTGEAGKGHGRTGHAGTQFEPHTDAASKARAGFAQQLADFLNAATAEHRFSLLALIATKPMLGELKPRLSAEATKALWRTAAKDLTHYTGPELLARVNQALAPPP
jgi:protein required for attachment to host cells